MIGKNANRKLEVVKSKSKSLSVYHIGNEVTLKLEVWEALMAGEDAWVCHGHGYG